MAVNVESLGTLERRVSMSVPMEDVVRQVDERLKNMARTVKMSGFRPGKVPMKVLAQTYGPQLRSEVLGDSVQKAFEAIVKEANLKVAGHPKIEMKDAADKNVLEFNATFEIYPDIKLGDVTGVKIERPQVMVDDAAVDRTIGILRKQRVKFAPVTRPATDGDRLTVDFQGTIDGTGFQGGSATGFTYGIGEGRMLAEFEAAGKGMSAGESKTFELRFPDDYHGKEVAGKTATFSLSVTKVDEPVLPEVDAEFAKALGVADGDIAKMRDEIRGNVEREAKKRIEARVKAGALQALLDATPIELPKSLVEMETRQLLERATADLKARGLKLEQLPIDPARFEENASRRVSLGLIIAELARVEGLQPKPADVRALIEQESQSYENPGEVVKWFYMQPERLTEMEGLALEGNVVSWILSKAEVVDQPTSFDDLMGTTE